MKEMWFWLLEASFKQDQQTKSHSKVDKETQHSPICRMVICLVRPLPSFRSSTITLERLIHIDRAGSFFEGNFYSRRQAWVLASVGSLRASLMHEAHH